MRKITRTIDGRVPGLRAAGRSLAQLRDGKVALLVVCRRCAHRKLLLPARLAAEYGETLPAIRLRDRLRCSACTARGPNLHEVSR